VSKQAEYSRRWRERHPEASRAHGRTTYQSRRKKSPGFLANERERKRREYAAAVVNLRGSGDAAPFVAYDGEAVNGRYVLLASSIDHVHNPKGLSTEECFEFLYRYGGGIRVMFSFEYDVTAWLRDVPIDVLAELCAKHEATWNGWRIKHFPRRIFSLWRIGDPKFFERRYYDVWGFFQTSFLKLVETYGLADDEQLKSLTWGKSTRQSFKSSDLPRILAYTRTENRLLEQAMERLRRACDGVGWRPGMWHGPGVLADCFLREVEINQLRPPADVPRDWVNRSRFGGRIELFQRGHIGQPVYEYDLNSAYPHALRMAPDLSGRWQFTKRYKPEVFGLYRLQWSCPGAIIGPFPFRLSDGQVLFPPYGQGVYHGVEVAAALAAGAQVDIIEGVYLGKPGPRGDRPLDTDITQRYDERLRLKQAGQFAELPIKLGLNAVAGKLAQRVGSRRYENLLLAGYINAYTRAALLTAATGHESSIVAMATDAIYSLEPLPLTVGDGLGEWSLTIWQCGQFYLPGINRVLGPDGWHPKTRGFTTLDYDRLNRDLRRNPRGAPVVQTMYVPYRLSVLYPETWGAHMGEWADLSLLLDPNAGHKREWWTETGPAVAWTGKHQHSIAASIPPVAGSSSYESYPAPDEETPEELRGDLDQWAILNLIMSATDA
jgi:hypothetical protein